MTVATVPLSADPVRARAAVETIVLALVLGLLADLLFRYAGLGINAPIWIGALIVALQYTGRHRAVRATPIELACLALSFALATALAWRDADALQAFLFLASGALVVLAVVVRSGLPWQRTGVALFIGSALAAGLAIAAGVYRAQASIELRSRALRASRDGVGTAIRVVVLAVPILLVFGLLFASADAVFEDRLRWLTDVDLSTVAPHVFWLVAGTWFAGGLLWATFEGHLITVPEPELSEARRLKASEVGLILGSLATLFAAFVAVQLRYLFGGHDLVQHTLGLTYAEYARRGFFELATAAMLLLPLLLVADWARRRGERADLVYRVLAGLLVALLLVVMASALQRMRVYEQAYGLTEDRLYVVAFLLWLAAVFTLFLRTLVLARNDWFVAGAIGAAALVLLVLSVFNPDAMIAERNIARGSEVHPFDASYAALLSADAAPVLVRHLDALSSEDACTVARSLLLRWGAGSDDLRGSWNWGRSTAARTVEEHHTALERACTAP